MTIYDDNDARRHAGQPPLTRGEFGIWCEVSGGITGHRQTWAKHDGQIRSFATREEAEAEARKMQRGTTNGGRGGYTPSGRPIAQFSYRAREF